MESLINAARADDFPAEIAIVLSNREEAPGLQRARDLGVHALAISGKAFGANREGHERAMQAELEKAGVQIICLAGYMRLLTPYFVKLWEGRMLNIHPSLLPAYPGLDTHGRALAAGEHEVGCTVHIVTERMDEGPILAQGRVEVLDEDDAETLADRVLAEEHRLYPKALADYINNLE
jgi:formyltetrahydrofolate-dependent phosphoribosylglycinamide formyltransferase